MISAARRLPVPARDGRDRGVRPDVRLPDHRQPGARRRRSTASSRAASASTSSAGSSSRARSSRGSRASALILILGVGPDDPAYRWLVLGIVLYLIAIGFAIFVQAKNAEKMVQLTSAAGPPPAGAPGRTAARGRRDRQGAPAGRDLLTVLIVLIVFLMVAKPGF